MPHVVIYAPRARDDLEGVGRWLTQSGSGQKARRKLRAIQLAIQGLRENPFLYAVGAHRGVRELPCAGGYRVLYEVKPDPGRNNGDGEVRVLRVFGPGQNRSTV